MWKWLTKRKSYVSKKEAKRLVKGEYSATWEELCKQGRVQAIDDAVKILDNDPHIKWVGEDGEEIKGGVV